MTIQFHFVVHCIIASSQSVESIERNESHSTFSLFQSINPCELSDSGELCAHCHRIVFIDTLISVGVCVQEQRMREMKTTCCNSWWHVFSSSFYSFTHADVSREYTWCVLVVTCTHRSLSSLVAIEWKATKKSSFISLLLQMRLQHSWTSFHCHQQSPSTHTHTSLKFLVVTLHSRLINWSIHQPPLACVCVWMLT